MRRLVDESQPDVHFDAESLIVCATVALPDNISDNDQVLLYGRLICGCGTRRGLLGGRRRYRENNEKQRVTWEHHAKLYAVAMAFVHHCCKQAIAQVCAVCSPKRNNRLHPKPVPPVNGLGLANESSPDAF
jgi:hypothetical protein